MTNIPPSLANLRGAVDLSSLVRPPTPPAGSAAPAASSAAGAAGGVTPVPALVLEITDATLPAILELSKTVPVIVELYAVQPTVAVEKVVTSYGGRIVLATVDAPANPQLQQAFQAQVVPTVAAVVAGRPLALFEGEIAEAEVRQVMEQVLAFAAQNGVVGTAAVPDAAEGAAEPVEEPLPPHHQEAYDAIDRGDYATAVAEYRTAIAQDPHDRMAVAGLAQVSLLDVAVHLQSALWGEWHSSGVEPRRKGNGQATVAPAADVVQTADGSIVLSAYTAGHFARLCDFLGKPWMTADPRFVDNPARVAHRDELLTEIGEVLGHLSTEDCVTQLSGRGLVAAAVRDFADVAAAPDVLASGVLTTGRDPAGRTFTVPFLPFHLDGVVRRDGSAVPPLGAYPPAVTER